METRTLDCGCVQTLLSRNGSVEGWGLTTECDTHKVQREADAVVSQKQQQKNDILNQLSALDTKSIRALREGDSARVTDLENQAVSLRTQLASL